ncbi:MAG: type II toxin-antitoxin system RelE/ParE family toxin [Candidatus Omnitrophica bacterium]|nr:type II toxin-antitoxin system RelE/ParE family toxin [Candidatus Omnitrophota bacterium]
MEKKAIYYEDLKGRKYVKDFIDNFEEKTRAKILARIEYLEKHWHEVRRPLVDKIDRDLYELRVEFAWNNARVLYAYMFKDYIVLLHGLLKKTDKIPENDKEKARTRMLDFQVRYDKGKIRLNRI